MNLQTWLRRIVEQEQVHFALTNRIPRKLLTQAMGWFSQIEQPAVRDLSLAVWSFFTDLELADAKKTEFKSVHDCFTRELRAGARPIDPRTEMLVSPCDGIVGGAGRVDGNRLIQAKGKAYTLEELLCDPELARAYYDGCYVTLRLTSSMYHRFHAPADLTVEHVTYVAGDTWNTNPLTVARVDKLYVKNERAIVRCRLASGEMLTLVPVAAILVASIRMHFLDVLLHLRHPGPNDFPCSAPYHKGDELGWFQHGSTVIVFAPKGYELADNVTTGATVRMGTALLKPCSSRRTEESGLHALRSIAT